LQKTFADTNNRVQQLRDKHYGTPEYKGTDFDKLPDTGKAHYKKVGADPAAGMRNVSQIDAILKRVATMRKPQRTQVLSFEDAQQVVRAIYENDLANRDRTPYWTEESFAVVDDVTRYFIGDPTGPIPLSKNLYVYGSVGVGKTYLFRMMNLLCELVPIRGMAFGMVSTKRLMRTISETKSLRPLKQLEKGDWLVDELGGEKKLIKVYGDVEDPMDYLITSTYEAYIDYGKRTHYTSNKQPDELEAIYGTRNYDRICETVVPILFPGKSIRIDPNLKDDDDEV
jgi:predicted ATPase